MDKGQKWAIWYEFENNLNFGLLNPKSENKIIEEFDSYHDLVKAFDFYVNLFNK